MGSVGRTIKKVGRAIKDALFGGDDDPPVYDGERSTAEETRQINEALDKKRSQFTAACRILENSVEEHSTEQFNTFLGKVEGMNKLAGIEVNRDFLQKNFQSYTQHIRNGLSERINRRIAISDSECAKILAESKGEARSQHLDSFGKKIIREGCEGFMKQMEETNDTSIVFVQGIVENKIQSKREAMQGILQELESITRELSASELKEKQRKYAEQQETLGAFLK